MKKTDMENYKAIVLDYIDKCFTTTIIGTISILEQELGPDFPKEEFAKIRKRILDLGNDNRRNAGRLLHKSGIFKSQYSYVLEHVAPWEKDNIGKFFDKDQE